MVLFMDKSFTDHHYIHHQYSMLPPTTQSHHHTHHHHHHKNRAWVIIMNHSWTIQCIFFGVLYHDLENRPLQCPRCDTDWDKLLDVLEARVNSEDIVAFSACFYCMQWCPLAKHGNPLKRDKGLEQKWDWRTSCSCNQERIYWYDIYIYNVCFACVCFFMFFLAQHPESMNIHQYPEVCM